MRRIQGGTKHEGTEKAVRTQAIANLHRALCGFPRVHCLGALQRSEIHMRRRPRLGYVRTNSLDISCGRPRCIPHASRSSVETPGSSPRWTGRGVRGPLELRREVPAVDRRVAIIPLHALAVLRGARARGAEHHLDRFPRQPPGVLQARDQLADPLRARRVRRPRIRAGNIPCRHRPRSAPAASAASIIPSARPT